MVGVSDIAILFCSDCKKETKHETDWESESPDELYTECTVCGKREIRK